MKQTNTSTATESSTNKPLYLTLGSLVAVTLLSGMTLASIKTYADNDSVTDQVEITVPTACTMTGTGQTSHTATLDPGTYSASSGTDYTNGIGKTTITTYCNDYNGCSIYAIGFTANEEGNNTLKGTSASGNATIATKAYEQGDTTSNWSMKLTKVTDTTTSFNPSNMTITTGYDNTYHAVPDDYTKVVEYKASTGSSATDQTLGAKLETTYAAYISTSQPADTYTGQVKYVMVHPYNGTAPTKPKSISEATTMQEVGTGSVGCPSTLTVGQVYELADSRDETMYHVARLADGRCWMLDNLALDLIEYKDNINATNTDINGSNASEDAAILTSLKDGNRMAGSNYATSGVRNSWTVSSSIPLFNIAQKSLVPSDSISSTGGYKIGSYYNYCAATAGSHCYDTGTAVGDATSSICPKNWRLPTSNDGELDTLYSLYDGGTPNQYTAFRNALYLPLSGYIAYGAMNTEGNYGLWFSSTWRDGYAMFSMIANKTTITPLETNLGSSVGGSVRCILNL